jgi:predicted transcriptional regulator
MPKRLRDRLETLSAQTRRSKSFLGMDAIQNYVEAEEEIIAGIKRGMADIAAGRVVSHGEAMRRIKATIDGAAKRKKTR